MQIEDVYTVPELTEILDMGPTRIHRLFEENILLAVRQNGVLVVPKPFIQDGAPVAALKGTATVLLDIGLSVAEAVDWLLADHETLGDRPINLLRKNIKSPVRTQALLLA